MRRHSQTSRRAREEADAVESTLAQRASEHAMAARRAQAVAEHTQLLLRAEQARVRELEHELMATGTRVRVLEALSPPRAHGVLRDSEQHLNGSGDAGYRSGGSGVSLTAGGSAVRARAGKGSYTRVGEGRTKANKSLSLIDADMY